MASGSSSEPYGFDMSNMKHSLEDLPHETTELPPPFDSLVPLYPQPRAPRAEREDTYIAIGIDFGATYSGVSWAHSGAPSDIHSVARWPCNDQRSVGQVQIPTQVDLETGNWGYLVPRDADPVRWFKLLLFDPRDLRRDMDPSVPLKRSREKLWEHAGSNPDAVVDLVAEFLRRLWDHSLNEIRDRIDVDMLPIKVAITVPAIWPLYAREKMKAAAKKAGILNPRRIGETKLILVEEPEAAAVATLLDYKRHPDIAVGESFIVCDCGGVTIDVTSYTVTSVDPFILKEAVKGDGKLCGAFLIDDAFEKWVNAKLGLRMRKFDGADVRQLIKEQWELDIKRFFTGKEHSIPLRPPTKAFGVYPRSQIAGDVVKQFYEKTHSGIRGLISEQKAQIEKCLGEQPKIILLVGGLGSSKYLYSMLQAEHPNILQPFRGWSAVSRGAVIAVLKSAYNPAGASLGVDLDARDEQGEPTSKSEWPESSQGARTSALSIEGNVLAIAKPTLETPEASDMRLAPKARSPPPESPGSDGSQSQAESKLNERKEMVIQNIVLHVIGRIKIIFAQARGGREQQQKGNAPAPGQPSDGNTRNSRRVGGAGPTKRRKRKVGDSGASGEDEEGADPDPGKGPSDANDQDNAAYACPYFKYSPHKYKSWRTCPGPGWPDVHRVKEHLYRRHQQPQNRCDRCQQPFKDARGLQDHLRAPIPCELRDLEEIEGFDADQAKKLKSRKRIKPEPSETEKWNTVYTILFPHVDAIPSPFYDYGESQLEARNKGQLKDWDHLTECEQHLLREVPPRLRQALSRHAETGLNILEEDLRRKATVCVEQIIGQVFQELRRPGLNTNPASPDDGAANLGQPGNFDFNIDQFLNPDPFTLLGDEELCFDQGV
ncbi:hypothetical protein OQA88_4383 [Cercophora sp. LCS_1]